MKVQIVLRVRLLWWSLRAAVLAVATLALLIATVVGTALITMWVGIPVVVLAMAFTRPIADVHRRTIGHVDGHGYIDSPYLAPMRGNLLARLRGLARDPARRRDVYWLLVNGTAGFALTLIAVIEGVVDLVFWWLPPGLAIRAHAALCRALLSTSEKSRLALRVQQLTESRAETVDTQAAELRRIERDLHDGAQARLVSLGMSLAMAEDELDRDPSSARALLAEARTTSSAALAELRDLVRGIHPPVLADRGLVGAVEALALAAPIPVDVQSDVPRRLSAPVESAAYFAVAEGVTNVIKHSGATQIVVGLRLEGDELQLLVADDGRGGADPANGTGLRGIERRLSAFDGTLHLTSPPGGPTQLAMVLPCASSSPKTLPSSGTG